MPENYNKHTKKLFLFMKQLITLCCAVAFVSSANAVGTNPPYVIPLASDGTFHKDGNDYVDKIQMTADADWYELNNVNLESGGFIILGMDAAGTTGTLYSLTGWAVEPALLTWPNPLGIVATDADYIDVAPGVYNICFHERSTTESGYNMVSVIPSDNPDEKVYPPLLYLVTDNTHYVELPRTADGEYSAQVAMPERFVVAYEPRTGVSAFIFGPSDAGDATLADGTPVDIKYGANTDTYFTYAPKGADGGTTTAVTVNLIDGTLLVGTRIPTGVGEIESDNGDAGVRVDGTTFTFTSDGENSIHDICGRRMFACHGAASVTLSPGVYIVTAGGRTTKMHTF